MTQPFANLMIRASAGTGKTFQLTNRFLSLLAADQSPARILASTFTRKAAGEILDRIVERLAWAAEDSDACEQLAMFLEGSQTLTQARAQYLLQSLLKNLHRVRISTLDAFFARLARTFCLELGLPPSWTVVDELTDVGMKDEAIQAMLTEEGAIAILHLLAKGEAHRGISQLVRDTVNQLHSVYRSTNASAWKVVGRQEVPQNSDVDAALAIIEQYAFDKKSLVQAAEQDVLRFQSQDWVAFLATGIAKSVATETYKYGRVVVPDAVIPAYERLVKFAAATLVNQLVSHTEGTLQVLQAFDRHYEQLKRLYGAYRFDDVTFSVAHALSHQSFEQFAFRNDDQIDHLLLDEFQDTSPSQWTVVRRFAKRTVENTEGRSFFCVGDVKQAIYGWRGGEAEIFDTVTSQLDRIEQAPSLNHSRRSAPVIIETVNRIFSRLDQHTNLDNLEWPVKRWCNAFEEHTAESKADGFVCLESAESSDGLVDRAVARVIELHRANPNVTIGVLTRKNATVNEIIYRLGKAGVIASEEGGNPLTDSAAVNLILSMLSWVDHPGDTSAMFHVATSPLKSALQTSSLKLSDDYRELLRFANSDVASEVADGWRRRLMVEGYDTVVEAWSRFLTSSCSRRELLRLNQLLDLAASWNARKTLRATDFVRFVETQRVAEPSAAPVRVMTVHQSKGLEFDAVVLPELNIDLMGQTPSVVVHHPGPGLEPDGVIRYANQTLRPWLPKRVQGWFEQHLGRTVSENLCVLYVAITRARQALYMVVPPNEREKSLPKRYDGLLRAALCDGAVAGPNQTLYQQGQEDWYRTLDRHSTADQSSADQHVLSQPSSEQPSSEQPSASRQSSRGLGRFPLRSTKTDRHAEVVSPSSLEGGTEVSLSQSLRPTNRAGLYFGSLIHKWFEQISWIEDFRYDKDHLRRVAAELEPALMKTGVLTELIESALKYFAACLEQVEIRTSLSLGNAATIASELGVRTTGDVEYRVTNESSFAIQLENRMMQGTMDRLIEFRVGGKTVAAEIVDFKTDRIDRANPMLMDSLENYYRPQMEAYCRAVCSMTGAPPAAVRARLLFVDPNGPNSRLITAS